MSYISGSFYSEAACCELVWAFSADKYLKWLAEAPLLQFSAVERMSPRLALEPLVVQAKLLIAQFSSLYPDVKPTSEAIQYCLAMNVLGPAMGDNWCRENLFGSGPTYSPYQQVGLESPAARKAQSQAVLLAEKLFNLQTVEGFQGRLEELKSKNLLSAIAELEAAQLIMSSGLPFRFVRPLGKKGSDYDCEIELPSGRFASCEIKSKDKLAPLTVPSILKKLKKAGNQAPGDAPFIAFFKIPLHWFKDPMLEKVVNLATERFMTAYRRSVAVVYYWEEWRDHEIGPLIRMFKFREYVNENSRFYDPANAHLIRSTLMRSHSDDWVTFRNLIAETLQ